MLKRIEWRIYIQDHDTSVIILTGNKMNARSQSFEHVPRVHEGVHGESAAHGHYEQTDDTE